MTRKKPDRLKSGTAGVIFYFIPAEIIIIIIPAEIIIVKNTIIKFRRTKPERHYNYKNYVNKKPGRNYNYKKGRSHNDQNQNEK